MARPTEFDIPGSRDRALLLFWRRGYQATSLPELVAAMGISRSSFYAAFGDKRSLFLACLDLFAARTREVLLQARRDMPPLDSLQYFLERHLAQPTAHRGGLGCMLVNTVTEMSGVDDALSGRASSHLREIQSLFEQLLLEAGCAAHQAGGLAAMLMVFNEGVRVASRQRLNPQAKLAPIRSLFALVRQAVAEPTGPAGRRAPRRTRSSYSRKDTQHA